MFDHLNTQTLLVSNPNCRCKRDNIDQLPDKELTLTMILDEAQNPIVAENYGS